MTLGLAPRQAGLFRSTAAYCEGRVAPDSIYGILHRECFRLFPDELFADLAGVVHTALEPTHVLQPGRERRHRLVSVVAGRLNRLSTATARLLLPPLPARPAQTAGHADLPVQRQPVPARDGRPDAAGP